MVMISSSMNHAVVVSLQSLNALASTHVFKYSVAVMMYLVPMIFPSGLIGPTKSISYFSNACKVRWGVKGISSGWFPNSLAYIAGSVVFLSIFVQSGPPKVISKNLSRCFSPYIVSSCDAFMCFF
jgi:hypothetical protein